MLPLIGAQRNGVWLRHLEFYRQGKIRSLLSFCQSHGYLLSIVNDYLTSLARLLYYKGNLKDKKEATEVEAVFDSLTVPEVSC